MVLTARNRVLLEVTVLWAVQGIPRLRYSKYFVTVFHNILTLVFIQRQNNLVHCLTQFFCKVHFNIILSYKPRPSQKYSSLYILRISFHIFGTFFMPFQTHFFAPSNSNTTIQILYCPTVRLALTWYTNEALTTKSWRYNC